MKKKKKEFSEKELKKAVNEIVSELEAKLCSMMRTKKMDFEDHLPIIMGKFYEMQLIWKIHRDISEITDEIYDRVKKETLLARRKYQRTYKIKEKGDKNE
jgi:hypothetical protein